MKKTAFKEIKNIGVGLDFRFWFYRLKWHWCPKLQIVPKFPTNLDLEVTNLCNLKCVMCPHSFDNHKDNFGFLDLNLAKRLIDEGSRNGLCAIKFNWRGEPLLHKDLPEMIRHAKQKGILETLVNTNGQLLTPKKSEALISAGLDKIIFSCDGATRETYEKIRRGASFRKFIKNIIGFVNIRNSKGLKKPLVRIQMVKMDSNISEVNDFVKMWKPIVDSITTQDYTSRGEKDRRLSTQEEKTGRLPCPQIWQRIIVTWDGKVIMCCRDWFLKTVLGDIEGKTIESFWHGEKLNRIRQFHSQNQLIQVLACQDCTFKESYDWRKK